MPGVFEYEIQKAADVIVNELFKVKKDELFVIYANAESHERVVDAVARSAFSAGNKPMVIWTPAKIGVGRAGDSSLPVRGLTAVLKEADAVADLGGLLYGTPYSIAMKENKKLRYLCMSGMDEAAAVRCIGRINYPLLEKFMGKVTDKTLAAKHVRMTTPAGEDVEFDQAPGHPVNCDVGHADTPGAHMLAGQIGWAPNLETINGRIVFDGSLVPPVRGLLKQPVHLIVEKGVIVKVEGGAEAKDFEKWVDSFNHPQMRRMAHVCFGFNPGALLTGDWPNLEDERVWGSTEWGLGHIGEMLLPPDGVYGPSHSDGICMNSSVWLDQEQILDCGHVVSPDLIELARELGRS
jgi:leucyl aminopeptidase (aminopeptidase T)